MREHRKAAPLIYKIGKCQVMWSGAAKHITHERKALGLARREPLQARRVILDRHKLPKEKRLVMTRQNRAVEPVLRPPPKLIGHPIGTDGIAALETNPYQRVQVTKPTAA